MPERGRNCDVQVAVYRQDALIFSVRARERDARRQRGNILVVESRAGTFHRHGDPQPGSAPRDARRFSYPIRC